MRWVWRRIVFGILIGVISGLGAIVFNFILQRGTQFFMKDLVAFLFPEELHQDSFFGVPLDRWMILWIPAFGGHSFRGSSYSGLLLKPRDTGKRVISMLSRKDVIRIYHDEIKRIKRGRTDKFNRIG